MNGGGQSRRWQFKLTPRAGLAAKIGSQRSRLTRKPVLIFGENGIVGPCPMINEGVTAWQRIVNLFYIDVKAPAAPRSIGLSA